MKSPQQSHSWRLAQFKGFYEDAGIEDIEFYLTDEYFPGLIGGSLDVAHSDVDVLFGSHAASGKPLKLLSVYRDKEWWIMGHTKADVIFAFSQRCLLLWRLRNVLK